MVPSSILGTFKWQLIMFTVLLVCTPTTHTCVIISNTTDLSIMDFAVTSETALYIPGIYNSEVKKYVNEKSPHDTERCASLRGSLVYRFHCLIIIIIIIINK